MLSRFHERLGTAGLVVAVVALIAALAGTAFAAAGLTGKEKNEVKAIAKKVAKRGPAGPQGSPGPAGPTGPTGAAGLAGANGTNGTNGKSVVIGNATGAECPAGGKTVEVEGSNVKNKVCNGEEGGFDFEQLPPEASLTGVWGAFMPGEGFITEQISFLVPLENEPTPVFVPEFTGTAQEKQEQKEDAEEAGCPGVVGGVATADPGTMCVYAANSAGVSSSGFFKAGTSGFDPGFGKSGGYFLYQCGAACTTPSSPMGTWAVTAE